MEKSKIVVMVLVGVLIFTIGVYGYMGKEKEEESEEKWVPYTPDSDSVSISIDTEGDDIVANVTIVFRDLGHRVVKWGEVSRTDGRLSVNTEIERYTGGAAQALKPVENAYSLGELEEGDYEFRFMVRDEGVKTVEFTV